MDQNQGRINQKRRTRNAVLAAAAALVRQGQTPSVAEAADAAGVSRATAYRYFPTQERLLFEAALETTTPLIEAIIAQSAAAPDAGVRVEGVAHAIQTVVLANEAAYRTMLRLTLEAQAERAEQSGPPAPVRRGGRLDWLAEALAPVQAQLEPQQLQRLLAALSLCVGIESIVVLRDICALEAEEVEAVSRWAVRTLLRGALAGEEH